MDTLRGPIASGRLPERAPATSEETADPLNTLLDAFEAQVQALIDNGLEPQLRARLSRLLPVPSQAAGSPAGESPATTRNPAITALEWSTLLIALRATKPTDGAAAAAIRVARAWVIDKMQDARTQEQNRT